MESENIQSVIDSIKKINPEKKYWFMRTVGGRYYDDFLEGGFIAIGYDEINLSQIAKSRTSDEVGKNIMKEVIKKVYPREKRPNYISNQLIDFSYNIKKGDIVVIPSSSTDAFSFGEVTTTPVYLRKGESDECPFRKRKKIKWLKRNLPIMSFDPRLLRLKYTQRTLTNIDPDITSILDRVVSPIYIKENDAHLVINIRQTDPIIATELFETWLELFNLSDEFCKEEGYTVKKEDYKVKINVQSPGAIEFISYSIAGITALSLLVTVIIGAEFEMKYGKYEFKYKTDGILKRVTDFLNAREDIKMKQELNAKLKKMEIDAHELIRILEQVEKKK